MVEHRVDIGREHALILVVHLHGWIGPPKEGLRQTGTIRDAAFDFQVSTTRAQRKTGHTLLMEHALHLIHPHRHRTIIRFLDVTVDGQIGRRTMVLWPVELNAARYPRTRQTHQRRLDDVVVVDEVALFDFVVSHLDATAQLG